MYKKLEKCKYCSIEFGSMLSTDRANHSRWCLENPKRSSYSNLNAISAMNSAESIAKRNIGILKAHADGKYNYCDNNHFKGKRHTDASKKKMSAAALKSDHRRLVRGIRPYINKNGEIIMLDSSWEEALARRLDNLNIDWVRPDIPIPYIDLSGIRRRYFPDFYLKEYDLFLDPKNPYALKVQREKIDIIRKTIPNLILILSLEECKNFKM